MDVDPPDRQGGKSSRAELGGSGLTPLKATRARSAEEDPKIPTKLRSSPTGSRPASAMMLATHRIPATAVQTMRVRRPQNTMISRCSGLTRLQVRFLIRNHTRAGQSDRGGYV